MMKNRRTKTSLEKLLKLARNDADSLRQDLSDIERARDSAESSLAKIDRQIREEETRRDADPIALAAFIDGARGRRHNLRVTLMTLERTELDLRERIEGAYIELKKLEHLLKMHDREDRRRAAKADLNEMNEIAARG